MSAAKTISTLILDSQNHRGSVDSRIFGGFLEHLGRAVYGGVFQPGHPKSNAAGFRLDVLEALKPLGFPMVRWPGGNYVSAWRWEDTIGPAAQRPRRADYAWHSLESNAFGLHEFLDWCRELGTEPMIAVNLGTQGAQAAADLVEYCNLAGGTSLSEARVANGAKIPFAVKTWCLGNEMDGPWQAGFAPAEEYAWKARQAGHLMKQIDRSIEVVAAGSSGHHSRTWMDWDRQVLEIGEGVFDSISTHRYSSCADKDRAAFLAEGQEVESMIGAYRSLFAFQAARIHKKKQPFLSFDEWNVWYREKGSDRVWREAPRLLEENYDHADALVVAQYLNAFLRNADVVKVACLAQIANVIAPILVEDRGVLVQSIYHPIARIRQGAKGKSLVPLLISPAIPAGKLGECAALDVSAIHDPDQETLNIYVVNRSGTKQNLELKLRDLSATSWKAEALASENLDSRNTWDQPETVKWAPMILGAEASEGIFKIPPHAFVALSAKVSAI